MLNCDYCNKNTKLQWISKSSIIVINVNTNPQHTYHVITWLQSMWIKIYTKRWSKKTKNVRTWECQVSFQSMWIQSYKKDHLKTHKMSVHEMVKYPCNQCESKFTRKGDLNRHKMSVHENIKYPCNQCEYKATHQVNVKNIRFLYMGASNILVINVNTKLHNNAISKLPSLMIWWSQKIKCGIFS